MDKEKTIEAYRERREKRLERYDGGDGSGNWGHVGRIGQRGGSEPGGGLAFRMEKKHRPKHAGTTYRGKKVSAYSSQSQIRRKILKDIKSDTWLVSRRAKAFAEKYSFTDASGKTNYYGVMKQKSAANLKKKGTFNRSASKLILANPVKARTIGNGSPAVTGTAENIHNVFKKKK